MTWTKTAAKPHDCLKGSEERLCYKDGSLAIFWPGSQWTCDAEGCGRIYEVTHVEESIDRSGNFDPYLAPVLKYHWKEVS